MLGLAYPLAMTGVSQVVFPGRADGSMVERDGKVVGSRLIGQDFSRDTGKQDADGNPVLEPDPRYFQSRPSATGYAPAATFFNNQGPNQQDLADQLKGYVDAYLERERPVHARPDRRRHPVRRGDHVGLRASTRTSPRPTRASRPTGSPASAASTRPACCELIDDNASRPLFGLAGEKSINVLELNLALDREAPR